MISANKPILIGAALLAFGAAFANIAVVMQTGTSISHLTGDISRLSIDLVRHSPELIYDLTKVGIATTSFFAGAFLAGLLIHHPQLDLERPYGRSITAIGMAFSIAGFVITAQPMIAISLAGVACGFQNSLASRYRGLVLRTTHLTGLITDFGITLGMNARGFKIERWKLLVPAILTAAYFAGGATSCLVSQKVGHYALTFIGVVYIVSGLAWTIYKHRFMKR